ncbi:MAG: hypothetical protein KAW17_01045 [Candidatus Eisenbacteria sp.]|nr:hypothetical protein [Candidatus Eisenbacteria bacterium]
MVVLNGYTDGAVCTVLEVLSRLEGEFLPEDPLLVHLADVAFRANLECAIANLPPHWSGAIPAFPSDNPGFSYLATREDGRVTMTAEKEVISNLASAGSYFFRRTREFNEAARSAIAAEEKVRGAYFMCPLYNHLVRKGKPVMPIPVEYVANLGNAAELREIRVSPQPRGMCNGIGIQPWNRTRKSDSSRTVRGWRDAGGAEPL